MNDAKRPYVRPTIVRVELNHQQAVLAACSTATSNLRDRIGTNCKAGTCRRQTASGGRDSGASS